MRAEQAYVELDHFREPFKNKYGLVDYYSTKKPVVFYSMGKRAIKIALDHKSFGVCLWAGRDILQLLKNEKLQYLIKQKRNLYHVSIGSFISPFLYYLGIPYIEIPIVPFKNDDITAKPKGNKVYAYISPKSRRKFNTHLIEYIRDNIPYDVIICGVKSHSREQLLKIYQDSFIGIKLADHEGFPNTVAELGYMGRRCISRLNAPNAIYWYSVSDIINNINKEYDQKNINDDYLSVSDQIKTHLKYRDDFLEEEFWKNIIL